jgi:hypothetical protein
VIHEERLREVDLRGGHRVLNVQVAVIRLTIDAPAIRSNARRPLELRRRAAPQAVQKQPFSNSSSWILLGRFLARNVELILSG